MVPTAPAAPSFREVFSAKYADERGLGFAAIDGLLNGAELRRQDKTEIASGGWDRDLAIEKAVANLSDEDRLFIYENGANGPASLRKAQARLTMRQETDAITNRAGVWTNVAADLLVEAVNPAQWAITGGLGMVAMGARGAVALAAAHKAGNINALTTASRAAMLGPATFKGKLAEDVLMNVAQGGLWGSLQDTYGGQVMGAPGLLKDLRDGGLEKPYAGVDNPTTDLTPAEAKGQIALEADVRTRAVSDIESPEPKSGDDLFDEDLRKTLSGEATTDAPDAPTKAPDVVDEGTAPDGDLLPVGEATDLPDLPPTDMSTAFEPTSKSVKGGADDPIDDTSWGDRIGAGREMRVMMHEGLRDGTMNVSDLFSGKRTEALDLAGHAKASAVNTAHYKALDDGAQKPGVFALAHPDASKEGKAELKTLSGILQSFAAKYLPEGRGIALTVAPNIGNPKKNAQGVAWTRQNGGLIAIREGLATSLGARTLIHEFGHVLTYEYGKLLNDVEWSKLSTAYAKYVNEQDPTDRALMRYGPGYQGMATAEGAARMGAVKTTYTDNMGEFAAEQFVKFIQKDPQARGLPEKFVAGIKRMVSVLMNVFKDARQQKLIDPEVAFEDFFQAILDGKFKGRTARSSLDDRNPAGGAEAQFQLEPDFAMTDYGKKKVVGAARSNATDAQRKGLYQRAVAFMEQNPIKTERLRTINKWLPGGLSPGLIMAGSKNEGIQTLSARLCETTTGAAGRGNTAAVRWKYTQEKITGRSLREFDGAWKAWASENDVPFLKRLGTSPERAQFNDLVVSEMLRRRTDATEVLPATHPVRRAADAMDAANQRAVDEARAARILGVANLPEKSRGYFTQELDGRKIIESGAEGREKLTGLLSEHFVQSYGLKDPKLGRAIAEVYIRRTVDRVYGNGEGPMIDTGGSVLGTLREEMENIADGITDPNLRKSLDDTMRGMGNTRARLDVDLANPEIRAFYNTDILGLNRKYVHRMSAEVATTRSGLLGLKGVRELRNAALTHGPMVTPEELRATDQVIAELFGTPVNGAVTSVAATNIRTLTAAVRLGGAVFSQAGDTLNVAASLGTQSALKFIPALPRLIGDLGNMLKGNETRGILQGMDRWGGQVGLRDYLIELPLDAPDDMLTSYSQQPGIFTTAVRHIGHASQTINFFRGFVAVQHRHVAEETLKHVVGLHLDGKSASPAIRDMGFTDDLIARLGPAIGQRNGRVMGFDPALLDPKDAETFTTALHRGVGQMIQSNFVGERNSWAHNDWLKVMTQFRTFSITAVEKQWGRQRAVAAENGGALDGYAHVGGLLLAQMAVGTLLYTGRVYSSSIGLSEKERNKRLKAAFTPVAVAQGALNASTLSGYTGDVLNGLSALKGWVPEGAQDAAGLKGQRSGSVLDSVPAAGYLGQVSKAVQDPSVHKLAKVLPGANSPLVIPFVNLLKD
jgi:hypothetical protein